MPDLGSKETKPHMKRNIGFRLNLFFFTVFLLFSVLIMRLAFMQFVEGQDISVERQLQLDPEYALAPIRGNIYDATGHAIAISTPVQSLFFRNQGLSTEHILDLAEFVSTALKYTSTPSRQMTKEQVFREMDTGFDLEGNTTIFRIALDVPRRIITDLTREEIAFFSEHRDRLIGLEIVEESIREYDADRYAVQLIGHMRSYAIAQDELVKYRGVAADEERLPEDLYLSSESVGYYGLELMFQDWLRGKTGIKSYPVDRETNRIGHQLVQRPERGHHIYLSIHKDIQRDTQTAILEQLEYMKSAEAEQLKFPAMGKNALAGYAVAIEVDTGRVIAMASMPDYDPNVWRGGKISGPDLQQNMAFFNNGTISQVYADPRDPSSLVPPGSSIKPLTILVGLQEGLHTTSEQYNDTGRETFGRNNDLIIRNSEQRAFGQINATRALRVSSNTFMAAMIGNRMFQRVENPIDSWDRHMKAFGLGVLTGSGLRGESAGVAEYPDIAQTSSTQAALIFASFGQAGKYTTLQLAQFAVALASKGKRMQPQFVDRVISSEGELVWEMEPVILNEAQFDEDYWELIQTAMEEVSTDGNVGVQFADFPYKVASKTGTSQSYAGPVLVNNATFVAYAPAENPKLAVAVIVPNGGFGAWGAAPIARKIFEAYERNIGLTGIPNPTIGLPEIEDEDEDELNGEIFTTQNE